MLPVPGRPDAVGHDVIQESLPAIRALAAQVAVQVTIANATAVLSRELARLLNVPLAVLSHDELSWRFESQAFPDTASEGALTKFRDKTEAEDDPIRGLENKSGHAWTAIALGSLGDREWALLLPGESSTWAGRPYFEDLVHDVQWSLGQVANSERADYASRFQRRLHAFSHRLSREKNASRMNSLVLRTLASQVDAHTGALATFDPVENALAIVATLGYPFSLVEHIRIQPGDGLLGGAYGSGKPLFVVASKAEAPRRLRYRSDSYMILPVREGNKSLAVIALTDRADGCPFDARDFAAARVMAAAAAPAFSREQLRTQLGELTELATVDPVTGLFNRRYFETRLEAEVERAKRQGQDVALLLIDIDDFKRVNDTRGHLEGDRTLREVADLLRAGVRIFDVCARYGGEEFVIVMPAASVDVAQQIAERIRARIERSFSQDSPPVTISVGVGMLARGNTADQLVDVADRALIAAKKAGKNMVCTGPMPR
jgi:diguanylate cyclase (GGDEF)-like protein